MILKTPSSVIAVIALASCGSSDPTGVRGSFQTPAADGQFDTNLTVSHAGDIDSTVAYLTGQNGGAFRAYAGIIPDQPYQIPLTGNAQFSGNYKGAQIRDIKIVNNIREGMNEEFEGTINLQADLTALTLSGSDGYLTVDAQIQDGSQLSGDVILDGTSGTLIGEIGADRAFGAFHGMDDTNLFSGGFVTNRAP